MKNQTYKGLLWRLKDYYGASIVETFRLLRLITF